MLDHIPDAGAYVTIEPVVVVPVPRVLFRAVLCTGSGEAWTTGLLYATRDEVEPYAREWAERAGIKYVDDPVNSGS